jgi:hypothetical protein
MEMMLPRRAVRQLLQRFLPQRHAPSKEASRGNSITGNGWRSGKPAAISMNTAGARVNFKMCRPGNVGPYASSNVRIDRTETNAAEGQITKRRIRLERQASLYGGATASPAPSTIICSS